MNEGSDRRSGFDLPLTVRMMLALGVGAVFVSLVVAYLARVQAVRGLEARESARVEEVARNLASRAAPLLEAKDQLRLSMIGASAAQFGDYRVLILDVHGVVHLDTGMGLGGEKIQVLTGEGAFHRPLDGDRREFLMPAQGLSGLVGEIRIRYPLSFARTVPFPLELFGGCLLACCTLIALGALLSHHWTSQVQEAVTITHSLGHGDVSARCERQAGGVIQDLQRGLHDLGRVLGAGAQQVQQGFLELAFQTVEVLERRGKVGHGERTRVYAERLTRRLGLSEEECHEIDIAARIHDLGEIYEPPPSAGQRGEPAGDDAPPDPAEISRMRLTPQRGAELLEGISLLRNVAKIIRHHREKFNGTGFPHGLSGDRIPLGARILGIADAYDQLTTVRHGSRGPMKWPDALEALREDRGDIFDPWLVDLFEEEIRKDPIPKSVNQPVMISAGGLPPYKFAMQGEAKPAAETPVYWSEEMEADLEVLGEDSGEETA